MNKRTIQEELLNLFDTYINSNSSDTIDETLELEGLKKVRTYSDAGLLTDNLGLVLTFKSGEVFQLTIKRAN